MACLAFGRFKMHAEAGSGVHLYYAAPCFTDRAGNIRRQEIDSSNIQPDGHGCLFGDKRIFGMNFISAVDGGAAARQIGRAAQSNDFTRSEEHTSELTSLMRISYAVFSLKKKIKT